MVTPTTPVGGTDFSRKQYGSYARQVQVRADQVATLPPNVSFEDAACLPVALWNPQFGVLSYVWVGLMNPHRFVYRLSTFPVALTFALATLAAMVVRRRFGRFPVRTETVLILIWCCYTTFTTTLALNQQEAWVGWDRLSKILLMAIVASMLLQSRNTGGLRIWKSAVNADRSPSAKRTTSESRSEF